MVIVFTYFIHRLLLQKLKPWSFLVWKNNWLVHTVARLISTTHIPYLVFGSPLCYPSFHNTRPYIISLSIFLIMPYPEILVRDMLVSGVISNDWQYYDGNESLLWTTNPGSITWHAQVSREPPSTLSLLSVWRSIYRISNRVSLSSEDAKRIIIEGTGNGCECGMTPRGGRQGIPFNLPRCSSNLCHYHWNKRA